MDQLGPTSPLARITKQLPASPERVFDAWLDELSFAAWMCPEGGSVTAAEVDRRKGGRYRLVVRIDGKDHEHTGEYRELTHPERIVFTWRSPETGSQESLVTVDLFASGEQTNLVLTHEMLPENTKAAEQVATWRKRLARLAARLQG